MLTLLSESGILMRFGFQLDEACLALYRLERGEPLDEPARDAISGICDFLRAGMECARLFADMRICTNDDGGVCYELLGRAEGFPKALGMWTLALQGLAADVDGIIWFDGLAPIRDFLESLSHKSLHKTGVLLDRREM